MSLMRKERKSAYEKWSALPENAGDPATMSRELLDLRELEKLRQHEALRWVLEDLVAALRSAG